MIASRNREVRDLETEDATITGEIAAIDTSEGDVGCGDAITYPSALIRPEYDDLPENVEITFIDGWGERETIERAVE